MRKLGTLLALILSLGTIFSVNAHTTTPVGWAALSSIPAPQSDAPPAAGGTFGACVDGDPFGDDLYVAYGYDGVNAADTLSFRIYDHDTNKWRQGPVAPGPARHWVAGAFHNGRLYCVGGGSDMAAYAEVHRFDPWSNRWSVVAPLPADPSAPDQPAGRAGAVAISYPYKSLYVLGGSRSGDICGAPTRSVLRYDEWSRTWQPAGKLAVPRAGAAAALVDRYIYLFGGCSDTGLLDSVERFDTSTGTSTILSVKMPGGERRKAAAVNRDDMIYITGGVDAFGLEVLPNDLIFDPEKRTFAEGPPLPTHCAPGDGRSGHGLVEHDRAIYAFGGTCEDSFAGLSSLDVLNLDN
ncbi:MAG TPA: kelch repeat-containing protein [Chloroflexota bacterium]